MQGRTVNYPFTRVQTSCRSVAGCGRAYAWKAQVLAAAYYPAIGRSDFSGDYEACHCHFSLTVQCIDCDALAVWGVGCSGACDACLETAASQSKIAFGR